MNDVTSRFNRLIGETRACLEYASLAGLDFAPSTKAAVCSACPLGTGRAGLFKGWGGIRPKLAFVCATPPPCRGKGEYSPFTGELGELLLKIIKSTKLHEQDLHLLFAIRCIPSSGQDTDPEALQGGFHSCAPLLREEIKELRPLVVMAMGSKACEALTGQADIGACRGNFFDFQGIRIMPTHGIEELLRDKSIRKAAWEDIKLAMKALEA